MSFRNFRSGTLYFFWPAISLSVILILISIIGILCSVTMQRFISDAFIKVIIVVGLYIFIGNSGIISFGHASFMTIAAYMSAWLTMPVAFKKLILPLLWPFFLNLQMNHYIGLIIAAIIASIFAFVVGIPLMRLSGLAASIATFALLSIVYTIYGNWDSKTYGQGTLVGLDIYVNLSLTLLIAIGAIIFAFIYQESRWGVALRASREDEVAAKACGISIVSQRIIAFVLSAFIVSIGGVLRGHFLGTLWINDYYLDLTFLSIAMLVVGGIHSLAGAVLGPLIISSLLELLRLLEVGMTFGSFSFRAPSGLRETGVAFVMLLILIFRPSGIMGGNEISWPFKSRS